MPGVQFNPDFDIPNLGQKVIFVTGGTAGLGEETVYALAQHNPSAIFFSGRDINSAHNVIQRVKRLAPEARVYFVPCDLASLSSVQSAAKRFLAQSHRLDILICNAGIMAKPPGLTQDGYEIQFGTNHVGHALLIKKLLPVMTCTTELPNADVRIVILTSLGFRGHPRGGIVFEDLKTVQDFSVLGPWIRYGQSKLANILYTRELSRRYNLITTVSIHPGVVGTGLVGGLGFANKLLVYVTNGGKLLKPAEGAYNQLWAATTQKSTIRRGEMYEPVGILSNKLNKTARDSQLASKLWDWTENELESY